MPRRTAAPKAKHDSLYDVQSSAARRESTFDPSASPLYEAVGFVVGAPRSGTTWLQQLLLVHPLVATGGESHLFCKGLPELFDNFVNVDTTAYLSTWVSEPEMVTAARAFCDAVFTAQRAGTRPDATVIIEKTPNHRLQSALQARIYPDARYVHIIRDGRDSAASQHHLWGKATDEFANAGRVAAGWAESVRDIRTHFGGLEHYIELRYEDVVRDTPGALATIFEHLGLPYDDAMCQDAAAFGKAPVNVAPDATGVGGRSRDSNVLITRGVARAAGDLLVELGYATQGEIDQLAHTRNRATVVADAREAVVDGWTRGRDLVSTTRQRLAARARRRAGRPAQALGRSFAEALTEKNADALQALLAPSTKLDGVTMSAADAAAQLLERLGGGRVPHRSSAGAFTQLTVIDTGDVRHILRIELHDGRAIAIDAI